MKAAILWGSELSPYTLKIQSLLEYAKLPYRLLPANGKRIENLEIQARLEVAKFTGMVTRFPVMSDLDEYPLVPYLTEDCRHFQFDSTAIAHWLDSKNGSFTDSKVETNFFPEPPVLRFLATLIDDAMDEFGLYMVHHMRWVTSAASNNAGARLAREFKHILPMGARWLVAKQFSERQVSRLPYLFSVAPEGHSWRVKKSLQPPAIDYWPESHSLLNNAWKTYLSAMERLLAKQPYVLGTQFTIADASIYGQLSMNLKDPAAANLLKETAPLTYEWLCGIREGKHALIDIVDGGLAITSQTISALKPLLDIIMQTYSSLMVQNSRAYDSYKKGGQTVFNEKAFDQQKALYDGELVGEPFRSVVKTFQVRVWQDICDTWQGLSVEDKDSLKSLISQWELFEH
ncbi:MAG: glutathione S-transferase C-terminal domain-containing protein [Pseudomonadales bacterium]|nr:glutathione S-transferase C-terminal domain-containing protein [Pseudomonadales bacterium]